MNPGLGIAENATHQRVMNAVAAGTTDQNSTGVDMANHEACQFVTAFGTITAGAVTSVKLQQSDDNGVGDDWTDIAGSAVTVADDDDNQIVVHDIIRPQKRYVRVVVDRGTQNAVIDGVNSMRYHPRVAPTTNDAASVVARKVLISPSEGTA